MTDNKRLVPPAPRGIVCEKMCARCPFKPDGSGYAVNHPDMPRIIESVDLGLPFYCHETVIFDDRTKMDADEEQPDPPVQDHFELCRGGHERRMATWVKRAAAAHGITEDEVKVRAGLKPAEPTQLKRLRMTLARMEARLLEQGDKADDALVRRTHLVRADVERVERGTKRLAELAAKAAPMAVPINVGDVIQVQGQPVLIGRINHRSFSGWTVGGGRPVKVNKTRFDGTVLVRSNTKLRAAVKHRTKLGGYNGDESWRKLVIEGASS